MKLVILLLLSSFVYADDAAIACNRINKAPVRGLPSFFSDYEPLDCSSLSPSGNYIDKICNSRVPEGLMENCNATYYSSVFSFFNVSSNNSTADTVLACIASPASGQPTTLFKYVLCGDKESYVWGLMLPESGSGLPKSLIQSSSKD